MATQNCFSFENPSFVVNLTLDQTLGIFPHLVFARDIKV